MTKDEFNVKIDFDSLVNPSEPKKKAKAKKKSTPRKKKSKPKTKYPLIKPSIDPNRSVQINLDGQTLPKKRMKNRKLRPIVDTAYINEVNYSSKPGKIMIEISYSPKEGRDYRQGANYSKFSSEDIEMAKKMLERFG
jgi:hypothetical protein